MAISAQTIIEVRSTATASNVNGGGFDSSTFVTMSTDLTTTANTGNTTAPVVTSATYNFVAGDVNAWVFIRSGTNWIPGWYQIASVASNQATLTATIGSAILSTTTGTVGQVSSLNTAAGVATVGTPTNGTWTIDYSQQDAKVFATSTATTAAANAIILDAGFTVAMVGDLVQIISGTNFTPGTYVIKSVSAGVSATVDRNCTTAAGALGVCNVGGACSTIAGGLALMTVADMVTFVKATATYSISATLTTPTVGGVLFYNRLIGYTTLRTDMGRVTIQASAGSFNLVTHGTSNGMTIVSFVIDGNSQATTKCVNSTGSYLTMLNCKLTGATNEAFNSTASQQLLLGCEVTACGGTVAMIAGSNASNYVVDCWVHDSTNKGGINFTQASCVVLNTVVSNNPGASSDGIRAEYGMLLRGNTVYKSGRDGIRFVSAYSGNITADISNNILAVNAGYGINTVSATAFQDLPSARYNAFWSNTLGARNNIVGGTGDVVITGTDPTNDPFTLKGSNDFTLNSTAGAGALLRSVGFPGTITGLSPLGYADIGAYRHQDAGGSSGMLYIPNLEGI